MDKKIIQKAGKYFTETEKHQIIQELLQHQLTKHRRRFGKNTPARKKSMVGFSAG